MRCPDASADVSVRAGVQLVATAHGNALENVIKNPALNLLVGGIQVGGRGRRGRDDTCYALSQGGSGQE